MLSLDDLVIYLNDEIPKNKERCHSCSKSNCKLNFQYSSTDALYVLTPLNSIELYFIEFKAMDILSEIEVIPDVERGINDLIGNLNEIEDDLILKNKISEHIGHEIDIDKIKKLLKKSKIAAKKSKKILLYLKAFESLNCIIPWSYNVYCQNRGARCDMDAFRTFLVDCKKEYIIIQKSREHPSHHRHKELALKYYNCKQNPYDIQRLSPYPFNNIKIRNGSEFNSFIEEISRP